MQKENKSQIIQNCRQLLEAFHNGKLGNTRMPEDTNPGFSATEIEPRLAYFTLPMSLNYQRDSYKMWEAALETYNDTVTKKAFDIKTVAGMAKGELMALLVKHRLALQPNKHTLTWQTISKTVNDNWGSLQNLIKSANEDYVKLKEIVQDLYKKGFPYLSGPKIFNYWTFILKEYGNVKLRNTDLIEIAPDTHIIQCSILLHVITKNESDKLSRNQISERWREVLKGSGINPIDMHPPLWFWSKNNYQFKLNQAL